MTEVRRRGRAWSAAGAVRTSHAAAGPAALAADPADPHSDGAVAFAPAPRRSRRGELPGTTAAVSRIKRILLFLLATAIVCALTLAFAISYDAPCPAAESEASGPDAMRAVIHACYGSTEVLALTRIARPVPSDDEVLVRVRAAALNPLDVHQMTGKPYVMRLSSGFGRPADVRAGVDFAGTVAAVGRRVTRWSVGQEVFGARGGALADYVVVNEDRLIVAKPANLSFEEAASLPIAATTALQGLRDKGGLRAGQKVLINGASGGVGSFAVQIAKALGAEVTGVCSTRNVELVRSLGADRVIDYTQENFTDRPERYDLVLDNVGSQSLRDTRRVLEPQGTLVMIGGPKHDPWLGPLGRPIVAMLSAPFVDVTMKTMLAELKPDDLRTLADMARAGTLKPVIDRRYRLDEVATAIDYVAQGRARGKVIVVMQ